jgi:taurine---2-oxoglutarate transaminase
LVGAELRDERGCPMDLDELVFHPWTVQGPRVVPTFVGGSGSYLVDADGDRYLDFSSQLVFSNLGHQHPRIVAAIKEQADRLCGLAPGFASDVRGEAARLVVEVAPDGLGHVLFTTGGTEAIEHAVRMARLHTGRPKLLAAYRSYHGSTTTSIHLTGDPRRWPNDTGTAGVVHFFGPFLYRSAFGSSTPEEECERALTHLEQVILLEGPSTIAALVLEPVTGSSGGSVPPPGYLRGVRELCSRHGIVFIADEVLVGFGRTGAWFAVEHDGVAPDLLVFAKGVNSGYLPLGGVLVGDPIYETFTQRAYPAGMTYSGHPLACASAVGAIRAMHDEDTVAAAARLGTDILGPGRASPSSPRTIRASETSEASAGCGPWSSCATGRRGNRWSQQAPPARRTHRWRRTARPASSAVSFTSSCTTASTSRHRST